MKPYGIPRIFGIEFPDKADIKRFGFSTTDRCSRKDRGKNKARRYWKKLARRSVKIELAETVKQLNGDT
jgi:hypothetical protein